MLHVLIPVAWTLLYNFPLGLEPPSSQCDSELSYSLPSSSPLIYFVLCESQQCPAVPQTVWPAGLTTSLSCSPGFGPPIPYGHLTLLHIQRLPVSSFGAHREGVLVCSMGWWSFHSKTLPPSPRHGHIILDIWVLWCDSLIIWYHPFFVSLSPVRVRCSFSCFRFV